MYAHHQKPPTGEYQRLFPSTELDEQEYLQHLAGLDYQRQLAYEEEVRKVRHRAELRRRAEHEAQQVDEARQDRLHWTGAGWEEKPSTPEPYIERVNTFPISHNPWDAYYEALIARRAEMTPMKNLKRIWRTLNGKDNPVLPPEPQRP
ncbi:hypothetical protein BU16DRAFT_559687 [Lophium mytilinum]|uniref:Uncharacterized protein n=1 Tax=Lophium mytilinum TaxID=390894 RepID=A0A6A6R3J2_9PEZI|nr:hypothetical protein BU16DRAFT_559687 [Lophium mytilinum]